MHATLYTISHAIDVLRPHSGQRAEEVQMALKSMKFNQQVIDLSKYSENQFVERFGRLYEHSPWVAEAVWSELNAAVRIDVSELAVRLRNVVDRATNTQKMRLLRAHPELAGKAAVQGELTSESTDEQARARLDLCSEQEFAMFQRLNSKYNEKFGFPFIMAVRNSTREQILNAFEMRLHNSVEHEFDTALQQVHQIAALRLEAETTPASDTHKQSPASES